MSERLLARPPFAGSSGTGQAPAPSSAQPAQAAPASLVARLRRAWSAPRSPQAVALVLALWLLATANWALWRRLPHLEGYDGSLAALVLRLLPLGLGGLLLLLSLTAWPRGMKPLWIALPWIAGAAQYFMTAYGTVMDGGMINNILQTDLRESSDLFNPQLLLQLLLVAGLPTAWLLRLRVIRPRRGMQTVLRTLALLAASVLLLAASVFVSYRERGVVLVMHQMGSHGPAYYKRSTPETKVFQPECLTNALSSCTREQVVNVYDNSIRYNDHFLSQTIDWLTRQQSRYQTGMVYMSDHGESLGEMGIYLHGMPYAMAPDEQKHIPMIAWLGNLGERTGVSERCVRGQLDAPLSHDNLYHTTLGLLDVTSPTYQKPLDALAGCRS